MNLFNYYIAVKKTRIIIKHAQMYNLYVKLEQKIPGLKCMELPLSPAVNLARKWWKPWRNRTNS